MGFSKLQVYTSLLIISTITIICADDLTSGVNLFSENFFETIVKDDNLIYSPFSVHAILSLAYEGTGGETSVQFRQALGLPNANETALEYKPIIDNLNSAENITIEVANKIYLAKNYKVKSNFKATAQTYFNADIDTIDFGNSAAAAAEMNEWAKEKTRNKIDKVFDDDSVDARTQAILLNAIYFKGKWLSAFSPNLTESLDFHLSETKVISHPMMRQRAVFDYADNAELDAQILTMKYKNQRFAMTIILPNSRTGINDLQKKLSNIDLNKLTTSENVVQVYIPKFKIESTIDLRASLNKIGLGEIFAWANFSNMIEDGEGLAVGQAIQKAFIEVNEEGTEAAAITTIGIEIISAIPNPEPLFYADHPFIFFLTAKLGQEPSTNSTVLFVGKVVSPRY